MVCRYLVASNNVDDNHDVGSSNEPSGLVQSDEDVVVNGVAEHVVSRNGDGKIAEGDSHVCHNHSLPHGTLGRLLRRRRYRGLDLQNDVVSCVRKRYVSQRREEVEYPVGRAFGLKPVVYVSYLPVINRSPPCYG